LRNWRNLSWSCEMGGTSLGRALPFLRNGWNLSWRGLTFLAKWVEPLPEAKWVEPLPEPLPWGEAGNRGGQAPRGV
jgi:hypothetical protein